MVSDLIEDKLIWFTTKSYVVKFNDMRCSIFLTCCLIGYLTSIWCALNAICFLNFNNMLCNLLSFVVYNVSYVVEIFLICCIIRFHMLYTFFYVLCKIS